LAWLAWLALIASPAVGMPGGAAPLAHGTAPMHIMDHGQAMTSASVDDCCHKPLPLAGHDANPGCHCASAGCSALLALALLPLTSVALADRPASRRDGSTPALVWAPPLRPPLA